MSPTAIFTQRTAPCTRVASGAALLGGAGVYPGCGMAGWGPEGYYTGYLPSTIPGPIFNLFLRLRPTYGQMKANSMI